MRYPTMKTRRGSGTTDLLPWLLIAMSLLFEPAGEGGRQHRPVRRLSTSARASRRSSKISIRMTNRQSHVVQNPHALVVHNDDPSKLVLLGAEEGKWDISVKLKDGEQVTYNINVSAIKNWSAPLKPGTAPAAMTDSDHQQRDAPARHRCRRRATALDSGTGPVTKPPTETITMSAPRRRSAAGAGQYASSGARSER